jgi:catechol 2,3-dioxygenase-like lactoylglutathione lyase family enzyme
MDFFNHISFAAPALRVNNRDINISFLTKNIGFKLAYEENSTAYFSSIENDEILFMVEESPSVRTRHVHNDVKKLNRLVIKSAYPEDVTFLIMHKTPVHRLFKGKKGWAFEAISPEKDPIIVHSEDSLDDLVEVDTKSFETDLVLPDDFKGLRDYTIDEICLNVKDKQASEAFYKNIFPKGNPLNVTFVEAQGDDLDCDPHETWDIEILEYKAEQATDLVALRDYFASHNVEIYLDKAEKILVISDPSKIELWFVK